MWARIAWARIIIIAWARIIIAWARNNHFNIYFILGHSWPLWATVVLRYIERKKIFAVQQHFQ